MGCLFCTLKDNKRNIIFENEYLYVILDKFPTSSRHFLLITKEHVVKLGDCSDAVLENVLKAAKDLVSSFGMKSYNILQNNENGQLIKHCHFHLIEANETGRLTLSDKPNLNLTDEQYLQMVEEATQQYEDSQASK
ncbi:hypothetical protein ENBRE01_0274 [Enteropsectra breve]|nr:hypothetical protein ENBRE01_0274 [Enteropsectra breve]